MNQIVAYARETIGMPYSQIGGCAAVPIYVARKLGMQVGGVLARYSSDPSPDEMREALDSVLQRSQRTLMQVGDVVWLRADDGLPKHLGIVGDYPHGGFSLIHATNVKPLNMVVEHRMDPAWLARVVAVWRFPSDESNVG